MKVGDYCYWNPSYIFPTQNRVVRIEAIGYRDYIVEVKDEQTGETWTTTKPLLTLMPPEEAVLYRLTR